MTTETTTPNQENIRMIREALHIGLECFGEVERLIDLCNSPRAQSGGIPKDYRPCTPLAQQTPFAALPMRSGHWSRWSKSQRTTIRPSGALSSIGFHERH